MSDLHELLLAKQNISIEFFTGRNVYKEIQSSKSLKFLNSDEYSEEDHTSVSAETSEGNFFKKSIKIHVIDEAENAGMIRFFSLPILPSEKEWLIINFDDGYKQIHKVNYTKTTIKDFFLLRAVSHGAYNKRDYSWFMYLYYNIFKVIPKNVKTQSIRKNEFLLWTSSICLLASLVDIH